MDVACAWDCSAGLRFGPAGGELFFESNLLFGPTREGHVLSPLSVLEAQFSSMYLVMGPKSFLVHVKAHAWYLELV